MIGLNLQKILRVGRQLEELNLRCMMHLGDLVRCRATGSAAYPKMVGIIVEVIKPGWMRVRWFYDKPSCTALIWTKDTKEPVMHLEMLSESR